MVNTNTNGEIIHVPSKPPFSPTQQPTVDVFASVIDPKLANTLVRKLNHISPLENLRHVKRVRKSCSDGTIQLSVILCPSGESGTELGSMPMDLQELTNCYQFANMLPLRKKSGKNSVNYGLHHFIHQHITLMALLVSMKKTRKWFSTI